MFAFIFTLEPQRMYCNIQQLPNHWTPVQTLSQPHHLLYIEDVSLLHSWIEPLTLEQNPFRLNWRWTHATTLQTGLNLLQTQDFDLIIVNLFLPDSQGIETFNQLQATVPHLPIIINVATPESLNLADQCLQQGATDYWRQPTQEAEIPLTQELLARSLYHIQDCQQLKQQLKQTEAQLREHQLFEQRIHTTQDQIQRVLEAINDVVLILDATANNIQVLPTRLTLDDPIKAEILNQTLNLLMGEAPSQPMLDGIARALASQAAVNLEYSLTLDTQQFWLSADISPMSETEVLWVGRDITDRRLTEERLKLTQFTLDQAKDQIFLVNCQGQLCYVNPAACQRLGYTREQLLQGTISEIDPILTPSVWQKHWHQLKRKHSLTREGILQTQPGEEFPVEISINYFQYNHQEYNCIIARDISDRRIAEEKLQQQLATIEAAIDGIAVLQNNRYIYLNPAHVKLFGYKHPEELIGKHWSCIYSAAEVERFQRDVFPVLAQTQAWRGEAIATRKDGSTFDEEVSLTLTANGTLICVCRDITQRKQAEIEVFKALETEQYLNELKSRFITLMSHEFRIPLSVISSSAGILETFADKLSPEKKQKHLQKIITQVQHSTELLNEILLIHQAETQQLTLNPQPLQLVEFCQTVVEDIQHSYDKTHPIELNYPQHHSSLTVVLDQILLRHILTQLLSNAVKFSPNGGQVTITIEIQKNQISFQIQDRGIGISLTDQKHLFESFYRAHNVGTIQGTGLGLSIVKKCVDIHSGQITIKSEIGQGTTCNVRLPLTFEEE